MAEKAEVRLGEPFGYTIEVRHDPAEHYRLDGLGAPNGRGFAASIMLAPQGAPNGRGFAASIMLDPFEASDATCTEAQAKKDEAVTTCRLRIALYDLGEHDVPDMRLVANGPSGARALVVPGPRVKGVGIIDPSARTEELGLRDPAPQVPLLVRSWRLVWWTAAALAAVALGFAGWIAWKRWRRRSLEPQPAAALPPHVRFERRLAELGAERLPQRGREREYFFRLSEMVREYLGAIFAVNALDLTTAELVEALSRRRSPSVDRVALRRWCEQADLAKYARYKPSKQECEEAFQYAGDLLEQTRPKPEVAA